MKSLVELKQEMEVNNAKYAALISRDIKGRTGPSQEMKAARTVALKSHRAYWNMVDALASGSLSQTFNQTS